MGLAGRRQSAGFTLLELLIVIAVVAILAGAFLPSSSPSLYDQLRGTAQILKTDLAYGRSLAVTNNSYYRFEFDVDENRYVLEHNGSNPSLATLPDSPFRASDDPPNQHIVDLDDLPHVGPTVRLVVVASSAAGMQRVDDVEFGPLGETTRSQSTLIWLAAGSGSAARYICLTVNPVTGLAQLGDYTTTGPPQELLQGESGT